MSDESPRLTLPPAIRSHGALVLLSIAMVAVLAYAVRERGLAERLSKQSMETAAQLKDTRAQIGTLTAKLDSMTDASPSGRSSPAVAANHSARARRPSGKLPKPDPRWQKMQTQLDVQGQTIEATRQELASTRSDLQGSIARTHDELVVLEKKGDRNYIEFDLDKSKNFHRAGPVSISLRKADTKHQNANLELLVDDRQLSKKHLNLYEPAVFYPADERQPVELVIIGITKNHIHGYISAPKYKASELAVSSGDSSSTVANTSAKTQPRPVLPH